jgi:hypothetical protein
MDKQCGGCGCNGGARRRRRTRKGGSMIADAIVAGSALGLYKYFTKKRGGARMPKRKTRRAYV